MRQPGTSSRLATLIVVAIVAGTFIAGIIARAQRGEHGPIDLIVLNGKVYAGGGNTVAEAVAVQGNKIVVVGSNRDIKRLRRPQTTVLDAHGGTVLPGLNDSYVRFVEGSLALNQLDLADAQTVGDIQRRVREYADNHQELDWIAGRGWNTELFGPGAVTREALDAVVPDRPVYLVSADGTAGWINSTAMTVTNITRTTRSPRAGTIVKNRKGEPTGLLRAAAMEIVERAMPAVANEDKLEAMRAGIEEAHSLGITSVQNGGEEADELRTFDELRAAGDLKLRVYQALAVPNAASDDELSRLEETRKQYGDDPLLKTGAAEIDAEDIDPDRLKRLIATLDRRGWQIWIRTASEQARQWALDAVHAAADARPLPEGERRHRVEDVDLPFASEWPAGSLDPLKALREAFSSHDEAPESTPAPVPLPALRTAVDAYTSAAAHASFDEQRKGKIAPGMLADLVIFSGDLFATPPERMLDVKVDVTIFDGEVVYTRAE